MNKKRLLILGAIVVLSLGSLGAVRYLATGKGIEESEGGYVQNLAESSEDEQSSIKPSVVRQSQTESSKDEQNPTSQSEEQDLAEPSETEEESTHVPQYADCTESISTYFDLDIDDMMELSRNTAEHAQEFDYQYEYQYVEDLNFDPDLFSDSVNNIVYADIACHKILLSVLARYADDHGEDYRVFEMESYYKSMWVEEGFWGHKVLDTAADKTLYIAFADIGFKAVGYLYKVV